MHKKRKAISEQHVECARIYVDKKNHSNFRVECLYCYKVFDYFRNFIGHIASSRHDLTQSHNNAAADDTLVLHEPELVLIAEDKAKILDEKVDEADYDRNFQVATVRSSDSRLEMHKIEVNGNADDDDHTDDGYGHNDNNDENVLDVSTTLIINSNVHAQERPKTQPKNSNQRVRVFFSLRDTNPEVMIDFIDIIGSHPCHWDCNDPGYMIKERRDESAEQIAELLLERWNIKTTAQETRNSILHMCRWFEREYMHSHISSICGQQNESAYKCVHPEYYRRLLAFLPTRHLTWLKCDECQRHFKTEATLLSHKYMAHNGDRPYKCHYCPRTFVHLSTYRHHENRHTKERTWPCDLCAYRGVSKTDHMLHMNTHTNVRNYVCSECGAAYKSSTSLNVHKRTHAPPKLTCHICGRKFYENYRLKLHIKQRHKHGEELSCKHKCNSCESEFASLSAMLKHIRQEHNIPAAVIDQTEMVDNSVTPSQEEYIEVETLDNDIYEDVEHLDDNSDEYDYYVDDIC